jgi:stress response protein YsnF
MTMNPRSPDEPAGFHSGPDSPAEPSLGNGNAAAGIQATTSLSDVQVIPVVAEFLQVERKQRESVLRIRKVVHEREAVVDDELKDQKVSIERVAVGRTLDAPVAVRHEGDLMIVPIMEERLVVEKRLVLVEELHIRREFHVHREPQHVTLRREVVIVERFDPATDTWTEVDTPLRTLLPATAEPDKGAPLGHPGTAEPATSQMGDRPSGTAPNPSS